MSTRGSSLRRRRSDIEDEEDADIIRSSQRSTPSTPDSRKRPRNHASDSDTPPETPEHEGTAVNPLSQPINGGGTMRNVNLSQSDDGEESGASKFQPGAIVRVKLKNFVTYAETTFWPGPNLNMIIGPNGTGKSSLVCAICLGLGWGPQHLGRGGQIGEFVKHGLDTAYIEIELQCRDNETENNVVRLKIIRDGNGREWFLNGKKTSLKAIQTLTKSLSIQIDNLCQFLPQDKVSEFAALSPVDLLMQTQRAAAPEQMLEWHEELKKKRKDQKLVEEQLDRDKEQLGTLETRQDNLRAEVQRLEERNQIQETVELLKKSIPFVEYREVRAQHKAARLNKKVAESRLNHLNKQVEPTLQQVNKKEEYVAQLGQIIREREQILQKEERGAEQCLKEIDLLSKNLQENEQKLNAENSAQNKRKVDEKRFERALSDLKARAREPEPEFHAPEYNERIVSLRKSRDNQY
jgi:chromosome segregation ATPase